MLSSAALLYYRHQMQLPGIAILSNLTNVIHVMGLWLSLSVLRKVAHIFARIAL